MRLSRQEQGAKNIAKLVRLMGLDMRSFAKILGLHQSTVQAYIGKAGHIDGKRKFAKPSVKTAMKIVHLAKTHGIDIDLEYLFPS